MNRQNESTQKRPLFTLTLAALAACLSFPLPAVAGEGDAAGPGVSQQYNHAPVTLWLAPHVGTGGMSSARVKTNLALSLGASGYARLEGVDIGVFGSVVTEQMAGAQITSGFNYVGGDGRGVQVTAGANIARQQMTGVQVGALFNYGQAVTGAQIGLLNISDEVTGTQIGLVNIGRRIRGAQIGLLNLGDESSAPIGVLNLVSKGQQHLVVWSSDSAPVSVGVKLGSKHVYSVLAAGFETSGGKRRWMAGLGLGAHVPVTERVYLEGELLTWHVNEEKAWSLEQNSLHTLRIIGGFRVAQRFSVFAGPTLNLLVTDVGDGSGFGMIRGARLSAEGSRTTMRAWPGLVAGVQI